MSGTEKNDISSDDHEKLKDYVDEKINEFRNSVNEFSEEITVVKTETIKKETCDLKHAMMVQQQSFLSERFSNIERAASEQREKMDTGFENVQNEMKTMEESINKKLDVINSALKGNGKVGVFEEVRYIKTEIKVLFGIIILLAGFRIFGNSAEEAISEWIRKPKPNVVATSQPSIYIQPGSHITIGKDLPTTTP